MFGYQGITDRRLGLAKEEMTDFEHDVIMSDGVRLHVVKAGSKSGELLILLHGFPEDWSAWREQITLLSEQGYWVWAPDQRGYNLSDKPKKISQYAIDVLASDILQLIRSSGKQKATIIGHDWGASVAWWLAVHYPERLNRLIVLNGAHVKVAWSKRKWNVVQMLKSLYVLFFLLPLIPEWLISRRDWRLLVNKLVKTSKRCTFKPSQIEAYKNAWKVPGAFRAMLNWYRAGILFFPKLIDQGLVDIPVLMLWGKNDAFIDQQLAHESIELCSNGKLILFENSGHWILHEQSEAVNREILSFLSST